MPDEVDEIIEFVIKHGDGLYSNFSKEKLRNVTRLHLNYGTCMVIRDDNDSICAVARWNEFGNIAKVLDVVIRDDYRKPKMLKMMLALGVSKHNHIRFIKFERGFKYPGRRPKLYSVAELLKRSR